MKRINLVSAVVIAIVITAFTSLSKPVNRSKSGCYQDLNLISQPDSFLYKDTMDKAMTGPGDFKSDPTEQADETGTWYHYKKGQKYVERRDTMIMVDPNPPFAAHDSVIVTRIKVPK